MDNRRKTLGCDNIELMVEICGARTPLHSADGMFLEQLGLRMADGIDEASRVAVQRQASRVKFSQITLAAVFLLMIMFDTIALSAQSSSSASCGNNEVPDEVIRNLDKLFDK